MGPSVKGKVAHRGRNRGLDKDLGQVVKVWASATDHWESLKTACHLSESSSALCSEGISLEEGVIPKACLRFSIYSYNHDEISTF